MDATFGDVNTRDAGAVCREVTVIYRNLFPKGDPRFVEEAFGWLTDAFAGRYGDFQRIDAKYHDLEHTLQGTLCLMRLLRGYHQARVQPELTQRGFELALVAILLHDTGYLKHRGDNEGTGAKYTLVHVARSSDFAGALLKEKGFTNPEIQAVQNMIRCTGVNADLGSIPFQNDLERTLGFALGTADLLGQMAAPDYVEKLEILYQEFDESNRFTGRGTAAGMFSSAADLKSKTPFFWEKYVAPKIDRDFQGMHRYLTGRNGANPYLDRIRANIERLQKESSAATL